MTISYRLDGAVAVVTIDDGKANALTNDALDELGEALDRAEREAGAVALLGRPGRFCAGFDLNVMTRDTESMQALVIHGAATLLRLFTFPRAVVAGCTGHALAGGAMLLLCADHRIGAAGEFKIGLNEVAIGMALPVFGVELARYRTPPSTFDSVVLGHIFDPSGAVAAGFLDEIDAPEAVEEATIAAAARYSTLAFGAVARTKQMARGAAARLIGDTLADDIAALAVPER